MQYNHSGHNNKKKKTFNFTTSLTDIKGYNLLMDTYIKDGRPEEAIITFDSLTINTILHTYKIRIGTILKRQERYTEMISRGIMILFELYET